MSSTGPHTQRIGTVLGGRYRLERVLGAGAMGAVYEAEDAMGGRCAVKLLLGISGRREECARFVREARITSTLSHPNVARVLGSGVDATSGAPYLVMALLAGEDLGALLRRVGSLPPDVAVRIILQVCAGLEAAHVAGVVHRDLKPSNIFLHEGEGGAIVVKVCDFGLAKQLFADESMTKSGSVLGSPSYMSPEQARSSKHVDGRTDVWSVGMTLYELLTGVTGFDEAPTVPALLIMLASKDVPSIQERAPWVSEHLAMATHGALLRDVDARCPNVGALMDALGPLAEGVEQLTLGMLVPPSPELRRTVATHAALPQAWKDVERHVPSKPPAPRVDGAKVRLLGHTLGGRYPLLSVLGHGGMGAVYETRGTAGERLAIKVILGDAEGRRPDALRRFVREARAVMSITSDHVVKVVDADTDVTQQVPFIVMEHLEGQDLAALLAKAGALEEEPIARIFVQACRGLADAHKLGIVHRDIKPANIFLQELPSGEIVTKICDFGVAKKLKPLAGDDTSMDLTNTGGVLGSPMYFSPEQARNAKNVDHLTDVWSLSISLYEAVAGRRPWESCTTVGEIILAVCTQDVPPLAEVAPWLSPELAAVIHKGLRREPSERYSSMDELAAALSPFAAESRPSRTTLVPISHDKRVRVAAARSDSVGGSTTAHASTVLDNGEKPAKRKPSKRLVVSGLVAVIAVLGAGVAIQKLGSQGSPSPAGAGPASRGPDVHEPSTIVAVATPASDVVGLAASSAPAPSFLGASSSAPSPSTGSTAAARTSARSVHPNPTGPKPVAASSSAPAASASAPVPASASAPAPSKLPDQFLSDRAGKK